MTEKHLLPSGVELDVTPLPYEEAWGVAQKVVGVIKSLNLDLSKINLDMNDISAEDILTFKDPICQVLSSPVLFDSVKQCFSRCTYNGVKIDSRTFESKQSRGDYLVAAFFALKENASPFFASLGSFFKGS